MHNYGEIHQKNWIVGAIPCGRPTFDNESQPWPGLATVSTVEKLMTSQNQFLGLTKIPTVATVIRTGHGWQNV